MIAAAALIPLVSGLDNGFPLPQLGWNSWNHYGCMSRTLPPFCTPHAHLHTEPSSLDFHLHFCPGLPARPLARRPGGVTEDVVKAMADAFVENGMVRPPPHPSHFLCCLQTSPQLTPRLLVSLAATLCYRPRLAMNTSTLTSALVTSAVLSFPWPPPRPAPANWAQKVLCRVGHECY